MLYFEKYHGTGNDFIIFNGVENKYNNKMELAQKVCHRNFGIGADGMMIVEKSEVAHVKMDFYNADGSLAPMCGNGIRCFAKYVFDNKMVDSTDFKVETLAGIMKVKLTHLENKANSVSINMGKPYFNLEPQDVILDVDIKEYINQILTVENQNFNMSILTMGTLHAVIIVEDLEQIDIGHYGKLIESHSMFPKRINVNFTEILDEENIKVKTYERGVGKTLSCGTGSAAAAIITSLLGHTTKNVNVQVPGGTLTIEQKQKGTYMTGPAQLICRGEYNHPHPNQL